MELRVRNSPSFSQSRPNLPCAQCGTTLFAPAWSEYLDDHRVRHLWSCRTCGYQFEALVSFPVEPRRQAS